MQWYKFTVDTRNESGAGTDANVYIQLFGTRPSRKVSLDDGRDNFEKGSRDIFTINVDDIGPLSGFELGHDDSGDESGWKPGWTQLEYLGTGSQPSSQRIGEPQRVNINAWLSKDTDGYRGDTDASLKYKYDFAELWGPAPEPGIAIDKPTGLWTDHPTGIITKIDVVRETREISIDVSRDAVVRLAETKEHAESYGAEATAWKSVGAEATDGVATISASAGVSATLRTEFAKHHTNTEGAEAARHVGRGETTKISGLAEGEVALVLYETYIMRRGTPGGARLGDEQAYFCDNFEYQHPHVERFKNQQALEARLEVLFRENPTYESLMSRFD